MPISRFPFLLAALGLACGLSLSVPERALGQESSRLLLPEDLEVKGRLRQIEELAQRGQWDKVVLGLDRLLKEGGSKLVRPAEGQGFTSVRAEARRRLLALSGRALRTYLLAHEEEAEALLGIGRRSPRPDPFERILAEHPAAPQASAAQRLLANRYLERGEFDAALVHLDALLADTRGADFAPEARQLRALTFALLGRRGAALQALDEAGLGEAEGKALRGRLDAILGAGRVELAAPPSPGALAWRRPVFGYYETQSGGSAPWSLPASDGARVYVHDGSHAQAIDLATGRIRWRTQLGEVDAFVRPEGTCSLSLGRGVVVCASPRRVAAFDQESGHRLWERPLAGLQRQAEVDFEAALGVETPPALVGGVVVVPLVTQHQDREVHLLGLDLATGDLAWSVFVASETGGALPRPGLAAEGGRCFAVSGHGAVAAVNASGELLWLRTYPSRRDKARGPRNPLGLRPERGQPEPETGPGSSLALVGGALWIAPSDGKGFLAFDPSDGTPRGSHEAKDARLLGARGLQAVGLSATKNNATLVLIERSKTAGVCELPGPVADQRVAWAGASIYALQGQELRVYPLGGGAPARHTLAGPAGNVLVSGGRLVSAAPAGVDAYGLAAEGSAPAGDAPSILAALSDPRFLTREAASAALLASESPVTQAELATLSAGGAGEEASLRATIALGELERRERLALWRPLTKAAWEDAVPDLLNRLTHPNAEVRLQGLVALGELTDPDVNTLMVQLTQDRDGRVAFRAAGVLLVKGDRRGMELVGRALAGGVPLSDRLQAGALLLEHGQAGDAELALPGLADAEPEVRAISLRAALKLSEGRLLSRVEALAKDKDPSVRLAMIESIADLVSVNARAKAIVTDAISDPDDRVRLLVVQRLADLQTIDACRVLCLALGDSVPLIAKTASGAINKQIQVQQQRQDLTPGERKTRTLALIDPRGLAAGAQQKDDAIRYYVAQITLRYFDEGGRVPIPTITRFMGDSRRQIRSMRIGIGGAMKPWGQLLLEAVDGQVLQASDVAAIASLTLAEEATPRLQAYQFLAEAAGAPGRGEILAQGLADENESIRRDVAAWLAPGEGKPSLIDLPAARAILLIAVGAERAEGREAALALLKSAGRERLATHLIELVKDPQLEGAAWTLAVETLSAMTEGAVPFDYGATRAELGLRFQRWWFKVVHGEEGGDELAQALESSNPSERFMAARKAAKLPTPGMRRALIKSLEGETTGWVLKEKLAALVQVSGRSFGFEKTMKLPELKACAERFRAWEAAGAPAEEGQ